jgi:hypothetical protein
MKYTKEQISKIIDKWMLHEMVLCGICCGDGCIHCDGVGATEEHIDMSKNISQRLEKCTEEICPGMENPAEEIARLREENAKLKSDILPYIEAVKVRDTLISTMAQLLYLWADLPIGESGNSLQKETVKAMNEAEQILNKPCLSTVSKLIPEDK